MTTEPAQPIAPPSQIVAEMYESRRLLKWSWRFRFLGANGEKLGDDYRRQHSARRGVDLIVDPHVRVTLRVRHRDGRIENLGRIR